MRTFVCLNLVAALVLAVVSQTGFAGEALRDTPANSTINGQVRAELIAARDAVWHGFFSEDPDRLSQRLAPGLVAIQENEELAKPGWVHPSG